jgi:hypothetical protein
MSFAAMMHLAEGRCLNALLMHKVENSFIFLGGPQVPSVHGGMTVDFTLQIINKKESIKMSSPGMKCSKI